MLKSDIPKKEPDLTLGVLQNVLLSSNRLYEQILKEFPELVKIKPSLSAGGANPCRTPAEVQQLERASENYLKELAKTHPRSQLKDWASLSPLVPVLRHLSPKKRDDYLDLVAQSLADQAADSPEFHGVFLSKLYKFTSQAAAPFFGGESKAMTDLTLVRDTDRIRPIILGSQAIDQSPKSLTDYGFYSRALDAIPVPSAEQINSQVKAKGSPALLSEQSVRWQVAGVPYQAQFSVKSQGFSGNPIPEGKAPNYGELWKNGTLTGLVITSSNLKNLAAPVMGEYLAYYQAQGFTFQPPTEVKDSARFLKDQIESGRLGYLIKEAHSDGDEKNLFRMDVQVRVQVGERKLPDGRTERIQLMFPDAGSTAPLPGGAALAAGTGATSAAAEPTTALLPNEVFGSWVKTREQNGQGQMVYLNTSCWSAAKAVREIEAAQSRALLNIPSTTTVKTFGNRPANAEQIILTAIRSGKSYEEMRTALKANQEYRRGEGNHFIFPDDREYQENISQYLRTPLDIRLNIQGPEGRPYSLDQVHD